jgi:putative membrane protein
VLGLAMIWPLDAFGAWLLSAHMAQHMLLMAVAPPMFAMMLQAAVMWGWHLPAAMEVALRSEPVHYLMHASFLLSGLLFWTALARSLHEPAPGAGAGALAIVGTMIQMGLLSALLTFAPEPRFAYYYDRAPLLGLTALEDQQLAGLIMWVPAALPYLLAGLALAAAWLRRAERKSGMPAPTALPHRHDRPAA